MQLLPRRDNHFGICPREHALVRFFSKHVSRCLSRVYRVARGYVVYSPRLNRLSKPPSHFIWRESARVCATHPPRTACASRDALHPKAARTHTCARPETLTLSSSPRTCVPAVLAPDV